MERENAEHWLEKKLTDTRTGWPQRPPRQRKYRLSQKQAEDYVVLDFETTGLRAGQDKIIQIGAVKYTGHQRTDTMYLLINPERPISGKITQITGITDDDVKGAPVIEDVVGELVRFIGGLPIVAHNAPFDMGFLYALDEIMPIPEYTVIDTVRLARRVITETPNHKLGTLTAFLELEHHAHDALGDCLATAAIYQFCISRLNGGI